MAVCRGCQGRPVGKINEAAATGQDQWCGALSPPQPGLGCPADSQKDCTDRFRAKGADLEYIYAVGSRLSRMTPLEIYLRFNQDRGKSPSQPPKENHPGRKNSPNTRPSQHDKPV